MEHPIRIAVLGAGLIGHRHIEHIVKSPEADLHAVVDPAPAAKVLAERVGAPWFATFEAMLEAGRPDGVIIATPNTLHLPQGLAAIAAGLPALVEKPLADSIEAAKELVAAAEKAAVPLLTGHHRRHNPLIQRAKAIIAEGRLGQIVSVHGFFWLMKPDDYFDVAWRRQPGGGPMLINLIHDIDLLRHFCGEITQVQAFQSSAVRGHPVEESAVVNLRFASGALGTMNISDSTVAPWSWEHTASEFTAYPRTDQNCFFIGGTHGALSVPRLEVWSNTGKRSWFEPFRSERQVAPEEDPLRRQIAQFVRVIRGEEAPLVSGREGMMNLMVVDAIKRAAATGQAIALG